VDGFDWICAYEVAGFACENFQRDVYFNCNEFAKLVKSSFDEGRTPKVIEKKHRYVPVACEWKWNDKEYYLQLPAVDECYRKRMFGHRVLQFVKFPAAVYANRPYLPFIAGSDRVECLPVAFSE